MTIFVTFANFSMPHEAKDSYWENCRTMFYEKSIKINYAKSFGFHKNIDAPDFFQIVS